MKSLILILFLASVGCSSHIRVYEMPKETLANGTSIKGIPFRVLEPCIVKVYQKDGNGYKEVHSETRTDIPNQNGRNRSSAQWKGRNILMLEGR